MSFICKNGPQHRHETIYESKVCWGLISAPTRSVRPYETHEPPRVTESQLNFIRDLDGDLTHARKLSRKEASNYIDELKKQARFNKEERRKVTHDPRLDLLKGLIDMVPDGYYAVQAEEGSHMDFMRLSHPKRNKYAHALKIQTQHGPELEVAAVLWQGSNNWSIYKNSVVPMLMLLVADHHGAARRYAQEIGKCMRCNAALTDDRSRHYGIGPECEQKSGYEWVIPTIDESHGGRSFETLRNSGALRTI